MVRILALSAVFFAMIGVVLFASAGRLDVPMFWAYSLALLVSTLVLVPLVHARHPDLLAERMRPGPGERDAAFQALGNVAMFASWVLAGVQVGRLHHPALPLGVQVAGLAVVVAGYWLTAASILANAWFSSAVRLQADRGQRLVSTGPYALVRHPGYTGGLAFTLATPFALGSWWALVPLVPVVLLILRRTALEDAMLREGLDGYAAYAVRVRWRLLPGVW